MKKYLFAILMFLFIASVEAVPVTANSVVLKAENIVDFTSTGTTVVLSNLPADFIATDISFYGSTIVGTTGFAQTPKFNIGWTGPNYQDLAVFTSFIQAQGNADSFSFGNVGPCNSGASPIIPAGTTIFLNVTTPDIAATNLQQIYITGFYLF